MRAIATSKIVMAALMAADHQTGTAAAVQALELARGLDTPWPRFEAARLHAVGLAQSGHAAEALAVIEPFREQVEREGSAEHKGHFWSDYAYVLNTARRLRDTAYALERAIENARALGDMRGSPSGSARDRACARSLRSARAPERSCLG